MRRAWLAVNALSGILIASLVAVEGILDYDATIEAVEARLVSIARLSSAHADAAFRETATVVAAMKEPLSGWDPADEVAGRQHFRALRELIRGSPYIAAAWYVDANGVSILDSWSFPAEPIDTSHRSYFRRHLAGAPDPVIGDQESGAVSRRRRFTYSEAVREPDGSLRGAIVVGILAAPLAQIYEEVADEPGAVVGLFVLDGVALSLGARAEGLSPAFVEAVEWRARNSPAGSEVIDDLGIRRLAAWRRSSGYGDVYTVASMPISGQLAGWRWRSTLLAAVAFLAMAGFALLTLTQFRAAAARARAEHNEMAVREVHHRVKNAIALIIAMVRLRAQQHADPSLTAASEDVVARLATLVEIEDLLQGSDGLEHVDLRDLLERLCARLQRSYTGTLRFVGNAPARVDAARGTSVAIVVNELVVNALKHASARVDVRLQRELDAIRISVSDDGPGLPADFDIDAGRGFGLRAAAMVAAEQGGSLTAEPNGDAGASFHLDLPLPEPGKSSQGWSLRTWLRPPRTEPA